MEIEALTEQNETEWNDFCLKSSEAWFRHTTYWHKYILDCRADSNSKNLSFMLKQDGKIIAVVPLITQYIYGNSDKDEFANYDTPCPVLAMDDSLLYKVRRGVLTTVFEHIEELAKKKQCNFRSFFYRSTHFF